MASIRARMLALEKLLAQENPDIVCLQEIKSEENNFPFFELKTLGYEAVINGQKSYNGVAILSKEKLININTKLMDEEVPQARFIEAQMSDGTVVISVYVPNGNPPEKDPEDKTRLAYKLKWMNALNKPDLFRDNALMLPEVREVYGELTSLPITNAIRLKNPEPNTYSFWDFQMGAWPRNKGILLDALFINSDREKMIESAGVYKEVRGWDKTSDHAPIYLALK